VIRHTGRLEASKFQDNWRQCARRKAPQVRHGQVGYRAEVCVGVRSRLKINLDQAHARERSRFDVIDAAGQREPALKRIGDIRFNLLRRHP
jgi:hypothetical protein